MSHLVCEFLISLAYQLLCHCSLLASYFNTELIPAHSERSTSRTSSRMSISCRMRVAEVRSCRMGRRLRICLRAGLKINESKEGVENSSLLEAEEFFGAAG